MADDLVPLDTLGKLVTTTIEKGNKYYDEGDHAYKKAEEMYKAAGLHLKEAKDKHGLDTDGFVKFLTFDCRALGLSTAYKYIGIAEGKITLEDLRAKNRAAKQKQRRKHSMTVIEKSAQDKALADIKKLGKKLDQAHVKKAITFFSSRLSQSRY